MANFNKAVHRLLKIEGFYADHEADPGGETAWGISKEYWPEYWEEGVPDRDTAIEFYRKEFWEPLLLDNLHDRRMAYEIFEIAVNMGKRRAVKFAQTAHNWITAGYDNVAALAVDGRMGPKTLAALNRLKWQDTIRWLSTMNGIQFCYYAFRVGRMDTMKSLFNTTEDPASGIFFRGWLKRIEFDVD